MKSKFKRTFVREVVAMSDSTQFTEYARQKARNLKDSILIDQVLNSY